MPGHSSRRKGKVAEYKIRDLWKKEGYDAIRVPISGSGAIKGDVQVFVYKPYYFTLEVKKRNKYPAYLQKIYDNLKQDSMIIFYTVYQSTIQNKHNQIFNLNSQQNIFPYQNIYTEPNKLPNILPLFKAFIWTFLQLERLLKHTNEDNALSSNISINGYINGYNKLVIMFSHQLMVNLIEEFKKQYLENAIMQNKYDISHTQIDIQQTTTDISSFLSITWQYTKHKTPQYLINMLNQASREDAILVILANRKMPLYIMEFDIMW